MVGADSLEDLMQQQQQQKPFPVTKNDSFERIGSDDEEDQQQQHREQQTFLTEVEIPATASSGDVSDLLRDAQKVPPAFALKLQQNKMDLSATFSSLLSPKSEVSSFKMMMHFVWWRKIVKLPKLDCIKKELPRL